MLKIGIRLTGAMTRLPLEENARWAAEHGFADIETALSDDLAAQLQRAGLTAWAAAMRTRLIVADDAERASAIDAAKQAIDSASRQGVRVLTCGHGMVEGRSAADNVALFKEGFGPVAAHAEAKNVQLAFEHWPNRGRNLMHSPELWDAAFSAVPSPNLGLNFDPSHLVVLDIDWAWALRAYKDRVFYCHAKDTELFPDRKSRYGNYGPFIETGGAASGIWWRYRLPGFGVVDWHKYADILAEIGYNGPMNIEHEDQVWGFTQDVDRMREGLVVGKRFLEQALL